MISKYLEINSSNDDQQISIHHTMTSKYCISLSNDHQILRRIIAIQWMVSKYCASSLNWSANISLDDPPLYYLIIRWSANITSQHCVIKRQSSNIGWTRRWQTINNESHFFGFPPKKLWQRSSSEVVKHGELTIRDFFDARPVGLWIVVKVLCVPLIPHLCQRKCLSYENSNRKKLFFFSNTTKLTFWARIFVHKCFVWWKDTLGTIGGFNCLQ